ncbi:hypothetical protein TeGR_g8655 [Tetraparma gracilis]|uniref:Trafficking protein particle complex subunit 6A n=1 Tax=Tetraparma gracilis TaxID=2962635 RepID=A0ABQ6M733_9STRA|nr:hypothetical protein TeGR_g8655 [Tetraparma gracilis]
MLLLELIRSVPPSSSTESACATIEALGFSVGRRLLPLAASPGAAEPPPASPPPPPTLNLAHDLSVVKLLCKEVWAGCFEHQVHKLQTNHRGVFVLKDESFALLADLPNPPSPPESLRLHCVKVLAFPCGLIRGVLAAAGFAGVVVSCDFKSDGGDVASCSFNIRISP